MDATQASDVVAHPNEEELNIAMDGTRAAVALSEEVLIAANVSEFRLPLGFDDSKDPMIAEFQRPLELRKPGVLPAALRAIPLHPDKPDENALRIVEKVAGSLRAGPLTESLSLVQEGDEEGVATRALNSFEPKLRIRVHAVFTRNSDGKMSNGLPGQSRADLELGVSRTIALANTIMATANVELVFYPTSDIEIVNNTLLNQDFVLPASVLAQLKQEPPLSEAQMKALAEQHSTHNTRTTFASSYSRKMVLLFAEGTTYSQTADQFGQAGDVPIPMNYDSDSRDDIAVWRPADGTWHIRTSRHGSYRYHQWGQNGDIPVPADYDGDGKPDIAVWRPSNGTWYIINSGNGQFRTEVLGQAGDIPVPAKYDGDGKADLAVWRPSNGTWYIKDSITGTVRTVQWGQQGDRPVPADYDGDGRADLAVWRPSNGTWYIIPSNGSASYSQQWGQNGDIPVPARYHGRFKIDLAVWRPSNGNWYLIDSTTGATKVVQWGQVGDIPVPRDYDGDFKSDIAVWRPADGQWHIIESTTGNYRGNDWQLSSPAGGGFSSSDMMFVKLGGGVNLDPNDYAQAAFIAHEVGHYLHLAHPMSESDDFRVSSAESAGKTESQIRDFIVSEVLRKLNEQKAAGTPTNQLAKVLMDADLYTGVADTPPDPGPDLFHWLNKVANGTGGCGPIGSHQFTISTGEKVTIAPDRTLVMSYFKGCPGFVNRFSTQQTERLRNALINENRRPLVGVQLGDTSFPGEWVAAVWDPNTNGQFLTWDNSFDTFNTKYNTQRDAGFRLHTQQAYVKGGVVKYDGIWNPGTYPQDVIWGWAVEHFMERDTQNLNNGYVLHHLESYLLPDGQVRINAIWNKVWANFPTSWVQGWAEEHLVGKLTEMKNAGWRVKYLNAWNLPNNGPVRYDVVWEQLTWRDEFVRLNMTGAQVVEEFGRQWNNGFKFRVLDTFRVGNEQRYAGVWNPNTNGQLVLWGHTREQISETYDEMWQQGWKLGSMAMVKF